MIDRIIYVFLCLCLISCESFNPFEGEGEYTEKTFDLGLISNIKNDNNFKIIIVEDNTDYLILKGGENIINKCEVNYNNGLLTLNHEYKNQIRNFDLITAEIHLSKLDTITVNAPANISTPDLINGEHLYIDITTEAELVEMNLQLNYQSLKFHSRGSVSGGYTFSGTCDIANYTLNGITNIMATDLKSQEVRIAQNGIGDAHVWVENMLNVTFYNSGNIYYKGNPDITIKRIQVNNQNATGKVLPEK